MTVLHAGAKFGGKTYQVSGGLHGVGASVVNALSSWMKVQVRRDGKLYEQLYRQGIPQGDVKVVGESTGIGHHYHLPARPRDLRRRQVRRRCPPRPPARGRLPE